MRAISLIPIEMDDELTDFKMRTPLDGIALVLRFMWNTRADRWFLSIFDADENPFVMGLPLHINWELIGRFEMDGLPNGRLMLYDGSGGNVECGRYDLGDRCILLYEAAEES